MTIYNLWVAKRRLGRLEYYNRKLKKFQSYVKKIKSWKKEEAVKLNKLMKKLTPEEWSKFKEEIL